MKSKRRKKERADKLVRKSKKFEKEDQRREQKRKFCPQVLSYRDGHAEFVHKAQ
jgi:hypothetical protein